MATIQKKVTKAAPAETTEKVAPKAAAKPAAATDKAPRKIGLRKFGDDQVITLLVDYNPKRLTSASGKRFEAYEDGMTVTAALAAGLTSGDLSWDVAHDYIKIGDKFDEDAAKKSKPEPKAKAEKKPAPARKGRAAPDPVEEEEEETA